MTSFSERMGLKPNRINIQRESLDHPLRNALWNSLYLCYFQRNSDMSDFLIFLPNPTSTLYTIIWMDYYNEKINVNIEVPAIRNKIENDVFNGKWNDVLDLVEFIPNNYELNAEQGGYENELNKRFCSMCNEWFEKNLSAYRFVNMQITEITSEEEIATIENTLDNENGFVPAQKKLKSALELYSNRTNPDYTNSIKDSISAVESYCSFITNGEKKFSKAIAKVDTKYKLHPRLKDAFSALFDYTSDGNIRHGGLEESNLRQEDAKFMLVTCSAFINYLVVKNSIT